MRDYLFQFIFYSTAILAVIGAAAAVLQKNPVRAVLSLVFSFFMTAIIWMMSQAEFLSLILVLVYVGAVMTLFLFVVMMINIDTASQDNFPFKLIPITFIFLVAFLGLVWSAMPKDLLQNSIETAHNFVNTKLSNTEQIGQVLYTHYFILIEMTALLLLVAIIASICLVHRPARDIKRQVIKHQIQACKEDRLRILDIPSEHKKGEA